MNNNLLAQELLAVATLLAAEEFGVRWQEFDKNDRIKTKEKFFKSDDARKKFVDKLQEADNFKEIISWHN